jgi:hypothetical protein
MVVIILVEYIGVYLVDLPHGIRGFTRKNEDGSYTMLINARLSSEMQIQTYDHEIQHIDCGDYDSAKEVDELEFNRHVG